VLVAEISLKQFEEKFVEIHDLLTSFNLDKTVARQKQIVKQASPSILILSATYEMPTGQVDVTSQIRETYF
jgi:hypothetical protein